MALLVAGAGYYLAFGCASLAILGLLFSRFTRTTSPYPLPPGPPGEPIIGHLRMVPVENPHLAYMKWGKEYNTDVLYFKQGRTPVVVLNTVNAAEELLSKRGANYSDRPRFVLFEVMGWGLTLTFLPWGERWKAHRALLQKGFTKSNVVQYQGLQEQEARQAAWSISQKSTQWEPLLRRFASAIVLRIGFGVTLTRDDDPYIQIAIDANTATAKGGSPGSTIVDYFPILRFFPDWIVNSTTLKHARQWSWAIKKLHDVPFAAVRKDFEDGHAKTSFVKPLLQDYASNEEKGIPNTFTMADINGAAASIFIAGSNTTFTTTAVTILNLLRNPRVYKKAQQVLDRVIGTDRLPSLKDRNNPDLRYLDYVVEEAIRWRPLSPVGIPHKALDDDVYNGMFIPKGTCVYYNTFAMSRDELIYKDPEEYYPERFTPTSEGGDGEPFLQGPFGFGRRICVGRHLAQASVWIMIATLISTMDLRKPIGPDGEEVEPVVKFTTGLSSHPAHFDAIFTPRSEKAQKLLDASRY